jgi:hypothetical protein
MHNPVTGSGGMLIGVGRGGRPAVAPGPEGGRPGGHAGVADPDPAADHRRPERLGRQERAGPGTRNGDPLRPFGRGGAARRSRAGAGLGRLRRVRCSGSDRPGGARLRDPGDRRGARRRRQEWLARLDGRPARRRANLRDRGKSGRSRHFAEQRSRRRRGDRRCPQSGRGVAGGHRGARRAGHRDGRVRGRAGLRARRDPGHRPPAAP